MGGKMSGCGEWWFCQAPWFLRDEKVVCRRGAWMMPIRGVWLCRKAMDVQNVAGWC